MNKISLLLVGLIFCLNNNAQNEEKSYDFNKVRMECNWDTLNYQQKVNLLQIPQELLSKMSTKQLLETCLNYPLFLVFTAFNNTQQGFEQISQEFNGFNELFKRQDLGKIFLKKYQTTNPDEFDENSEELQIGVFIRNYFCMEYLLSQNQILMLLDNNDLKDLVRETLKKANIKSKYPNIYAYTKMPTHLIMANVLYNFSNSNNKIAIEKNAKTKSFLTNPNNYNEDIIANLEKLALSYIEN